MSRLMRIPEIRMLMVATLTLAIPVAGQADLIDEHIGAIGGEEAIVKLKTFKRTGKIRMGGVLGNFSGTYEQSAVVRSKAYTRTNLGVSLEEQGWNGTVAWKRDAQAGLRRIYGTDLITIRSISEVDGIVEIYRQYGSAAFTQGQDQTVGGKKYHVLDIVGAPLRFYIDPQTKMLAASRLTFNDPNTGQEVAIVSSFSDYSPFGGVKMPNRMRIDISNGTITFDIAFEKTEIGIELSDSMFEIPAQ